MTEGYSAGSGMGQDAGVVASWLLPVRDGSVDRYPVRARFPFLGQEISDLARLPVHALFPQAPQIDRADPYLALRLAEGIAQGHSAGNPAGLL